MDKKQYQDYQASVASFMDLEGLNNLTSETGPDSDHECPCCGEVVGCDPYFSWSSCECCGSHLGGNRYHATGYNPETKEVYCYEICEDCMYYSEYGQLDDMTMMDMDIAEMDS